MLNYLTLGLGALVLALAAGLYWSVGQTAKTVAEKQQISQALKTAQEGLERQRALSAQLAKEKAARARSEALLRQQLDSALAAQPDWANQPTPKEIQDALAE